MNRLDFVTNNIIDDHLNQDDYEAIEWIAAMKEFEQRCKNAYYHQCNIITKHSHLNEDVFIETCDKDMLAMSEQYFPEDKDFADYVHWQKDKRFNWFAEDRDE